MLRQISTANEPLDFCLHRNEIISGKLKHAFKLGQLAIIVKFPESLIDELIHLYPPCDL